MIRFLREDSDRELTRHIPWRLPDGIRKRLEKVLDDNSDLRTMGNQSAKEAYDHLRDILSMDDGKGISFEEMKRMKNWFENHTNSKKTKQYELYGGDVMMNWVDNQLNTARRTAEGHRKARKAAGYTNAYKKEHTADNQTTVTTVDDRTPSYNPMTNDKKNRLKELSAIREQRTVLISEEQKNAIDNYLYEIKQNKNKKQ